MLFRTLISCRARRSPGTENKPSNDIFCNLDEGEVLAPIGDSIVVDSLTWWPFAIDGEQVWIAQAAKNQSVILLEEPEKYRTPFDVAFAFLLKQEGGYLSSKDAQSQGDPGGETKYGICKKYHPDLDVTNLTVMQAKEIYYREYWLANNCINLPDDLAVVHFDACVNPGPAPATGFLIHSRGEQNEAKVYCQYRRDYYRDIGQRQPQFLAGWLRRVDEIEKLASEMYPF